MLTFQRYILDIKTVFYRTPISGSHPVPSDYRTIMTSLKEKGGMQYSFELPINLGMELSSHFL